MSRKMFITLFVVIALICWIAKGKADENDASSHVVAEFLAKKFNLHEHKSDSAEFEKFSRRLINNFQNANIGLSADYMSDFEMCKKMTTLQRLHFSQICNNSRTCTTASDWLNWLPTNRKSQSFQDGTVLQELCPAILHRLTKMECFTNSGLDGLMPDEAVAISNAKVKPGHIEVWGYGLLFVTLISVSSLIGVMFMPMMNKTFYNRLLTCLIGLAIGSLSGSSLFHLIPQAFNFAAYMSHDGGTHEYLWTSLMVLIGIYVFFVVERLMKIIMEIRKKMFDRNCEISRHDQYSSSPMSPTVNGESVGFKCSSSTSHLTSIKQSNVGNGFACAIEAMEQKQRIEANACKHEHQVHFQPGETSAIATVAWMIIFGDGLHNFIDGLSIGAAFNQNILTGVSISIAVMCEEFPHELGDFAILLNSGMTMRQALLYNFLSACTCYLGLAIGILLGEVSQSSTYIFAFAAGMFLYISLVDMVPEMNVEADEANREGAYAAFKVLFLQSVGWFLGVAILFSLAYFAEHFALA